MLQLEVVERMAARPGGRTFGRLSVMLQYRFAVEQLFRVPAGAFWPAPKVESALLRVRPRAPGEALRLRDLGLPSLLQDAFQQRRKTLRKRFGEARLVAAGIDPAARPEEVPPEAWARLLTVPPS